MSRDETTDRLPLQSSMVVGGPLGGMLRGMCFGIARISYHMRPRRRLKGSLPRSVEKEEEEGRNRQAATLAVAECQHKSDVRRQCKRPRVHTLRESIADANDVL